MLLEKKNLYTLSRGMASSLKLPYLDKGVLIINLRLLSINPFIFIAASEVQLIEILLIIPFL